MSWKLYIPGIEGHVDWALNDEVSHVLICMSSYGDLLHKNVTSDTGINEAMKTMEPHKLIAEIDLREEVESQIESAAKAFDKQRKIRLGR